MEYLIAAGFTLSALAFFFYCESRFVKANLYCQERLHALHYSEEIVRQNFVTILSSSHMSSLRKELKNQKHTKRIISTTGYVSHGNTSSDLDAYLAMLNIAMFCYGERMQPDFIAKGAIDYELDNILRNNTLRTYVFLQEKRFPDLTATLKHTMLKAYRKEQAAACSESDEAQ